MGHTIVYYGSFVHPFIICVESCLIFFLAASNAFECRTLEVLFGSSSVVEIMNNLNLL